MLRFPSDFFSNEQGENSGGFPFVIFTSFPYVFPSSESLYNAAFEKKEILDKIAIFLPGSFTESINSNWSPEDLLAGQDQNILQDLISFGLNTLSSKSGSPISSTIGAMTGQALFPMSSLVFSKVDPITLNFRFELIPESSKENEIIEKIINTFKKSTLPSTSSVFGKLALKYPPIWNIRFVNVKGLGYENPNEYKFMALTSLNATYGENTSILSTYRDQRPIKTSLDLTFKAIKNHYQGNAESALNEFKKFVENNASKWLDENSSEFGGETTPSY